MIQRVLLQNPLSYETKEFIHSATKANHNNLENAAFNAALVWNRGLRLVIGELNYQVKKWKKKIFKY